MGLHFFLFVLEKFPETHNYPASFNEKNAVAFYTNSRQTLNYTRNIINVLFTYSVIEVTSLALGQDSSLGWLFYMILGLLFMVLGYKIYKTFQTK